MAAPHISSPVGAGTTHTAQRAPHTHLAGRRLVLARVGWITLASLILGLYLALLPDYWTQLRTVCAGAGCAVVQPSPASANTLHQLGLSVAGYATATLALTIASSLICLAVGGVIVWRRSDDWMALLVALTEVSAATVYVTSVLVQGGQTTWRLPATILNVADTTVLFLLFALFPTGRFVPRWLRWVMVAWGLCGLALIVWHDLPQAFTLYSLVWLGPAFAVGSAQVYRYRAVSTLSERQQTKWVVLGAVVAGAIAITLIIPAILFPSFRQPGSFYQLASGPGYMVAVVVLAVAVGMAVLRSRLFDIDVIIRRTLVYGTVTGTLGAVFFSSVVLLQAGFRALTNQGSAVPVVISTLTMYVLFQPVRSRVQTIVDRRFYRTKYDAARVVATFGHTLQSEVDLARLSDQLLGVVEETMQPSQASLWLARVTPVPAREVES